MKKAIFLVILIASSIFATSYHLNEVQSSDAKEEAISNSTVSIKKYSGIGSSYLSKGLLYLAIAILLLIAWLLLNYKL